MYAGWTSAIILNRRFPENKSNKVLMVLSGIYQNGQGVSIDSNIVSYNHKTKCALLVI